MPSRLKASCQAYEASTPEVHVLDGHAHLLQAADVLGETVDAMPTFPTEPHRTHATAGLHHEGVWQVPLVDNLNLSTA